MLEGGNVCESTIMKKKNLQRNMEHKVGQFEIGYCFGSKIFGANIVWKLSWQTGPACGVSFQKQTHSLHKAWVLSLC